MISFASNIGSALGAFAQVRTHIAVANKSKKQSLI